MIFIRLNGTVLVLFYSGHSICCCCEMRFLQKNLQEQNFFVLFLLIFLSDFQHHMKTEDQGKSTPATGSISAFTGVFRMKIIREGIQNAGLRMTSQDDRLVKMTNCHGVFLYSLVWGCAKQLVIIQTCSVNLFVEKNSEVE